MDKQALGRIAVARKTEAQIRAEAEETGMPADRPGIPDRMQQNGEANALIAPVQASEGRIGRSERIGRAWKIKDEELWNPFEVVFFVLWIIFGFGFLMGRTPERARKGLVVVGAGLALALCGCATTVADLTGSAFLPRLSSEVLSTRTNSCQTRKYIILFSCRASPPLRRSPTYRAAVSI